MILVSLILFFLCAPDLWSVKTGEHGLDFHWWGVFGALPHSRTRSDLAIRNPATRTGCVEVDHKQQILDRMITTRRVTGYFTSLDNLIGCASHLVSGL